MIAMKNWRYSLPMAKSIRKKPLSTKIEWLTIILANAQAESLFRCIDIRFGISTGCYINAIQLEITHAGNVKQIFSAREVLEVDGDILRDSRASQSTCRRVSRSLDIRDNIIATSILISSPRIESYLNSDRNTSRLLALCY